MQGVVLYNFIHVKNAPKLDIDHNTAFTTFADKNIKCQLPEKDTDPGFYVPVSEQQCHCKNL